MGDKLKTIDAKVVGITFKNDDGTDRQELLSYVSVGDPAIIEYFEYRGEPAYSVSTVDGEQIGNLSKELAADIHRKYKECVFDTKISEIYYFDDGVKTGCRVSMDIYESENDIPIVEPPVSFDHVENISPAADDPAPQESINTRLDEKALKRLKTNRVIFLICAVIFALFGLVTLPVGIIFLILAVVFILLWRSATATLNKNLH